MWSEEPLRSTTAQGAERDIARVKPLVKKQKITSPEGATEKDAQHG